MKNKIEKPYTIGLDIGTNSVGYAVITDDYKLVSKKMRVLGNTDKKRITKNFIGTYLFDSGETAADRRIKRTTRRRYNRRKNRLRYLQEIFINEIAKIDESFFHRLEDSFLVPEDKRNERHPIFGNVTDEVAYHEKFPTIYHLREYLAKTKDKVDLRLIYMALAHIIKFRGHFLIEGDVDVNNIDVNKLFDEFLELYNQSFETEIKRAEDIKNIVTTKVSKTKKREQLLTIFPGEKSTGLLAEFLKLILGNVANYKKFFELDEDAKIDFSKDTYEEDLSEVLSKIGDNYSDLFVSAKKLYDSIVLSNILTIKEEGIKTPFSSSMIERYNNHQEDLLELKKFVRKNCSDKEYKECFSDKTKNGYAGYIDNGVKQEEFYKYIKKLLDKKTGSDIILSKIEKDDFLKKQRSFENIVIPNQIHLHELRMILKNQGQHYQFLLDNLENIEKILTFRIPYYVGPLARGNSKFAWVIRNNDEKITPFNFEEVVNKDKSAEAFIKRMTLNDLYLPDQKVLPKHSLVYEKYTIFNEMTKLKYVTEAGTKHYFDSEIKLKIFNDLFKNHRKISKDLLVKYFKNKLGLETVKTIEYSAKKFEGFNANYGTYHDLKKILSVEFLDDEKNEKVIEEIIETLTLFEDREMLIKRLSKYKGLLTDKQIKQLSRRHYTGWGRISNKLINGIRDKVSGKTILEHLINDGNGNRNFMQLIDDESLSFVDEIKKAQVIGDVTNNYEVVNELAGSPAIKKGILQSLKIVDELVEIMGYNPDSIVIEMAREHQTTKEGLAKSKQRLKKIELGLKDFSDSILEGNEIKENKQLQNDKLFLYYLQNGKDIYTGKSIDISKLRYYHIDHIIPQSLLKDDSIDNKVLTESEENVKKSDSVIEDNIVNNMKPFWNKLKNSGLMSESKYNKLTKVERGGINDHDKVGFIKRQLVETRQITKHVARILDEKFNNFKETGKREIKVITLKSAMTTQFRNMFDLYKIRELNNFHHAQDAYLNAVVAKIILKRYPSLEPDFAYGEYPKYDRFRDVEKATAKYRFYSNLLKFLEYGRKEKENENEKEYKILDEKTIELYKQIFNTDNDLEYIKNVLYKYQMNIVKKTEIQSGGFYNESILEKGDSDKLIPRKTRDMLWDPKKYGGVSGVNESYSVFLIGEKATGKNKKYKKGKYIEGINIIDRTFFEENPKEYLEEQGYINVDLDNIIKLPKYSLFEFENGRRRLLASSSELQKGNELKLEYNLIELLYWAANIDDIFTKEKDGRTNKEKVIKNKDKFKSILNIITEYSNMFLKNKKIEQINELSEDLNNYDINLVAKSFINLLTLTRLGAPAEFSFLDKKIDRVRYTSTKECLSGTLIKQSITGLYETRIDLEKL